MAAIEWAKVALEWVKTFLSNWKIIMSIFIALGSFTGWTVAEKHQAENAAVAAQKQVTNVANHLAKMPAVTQGKTVEEHIREEH